MTAPINASPAPVVSISSDGGMLSAVPMYNFPLTVPIPSAFNFATDWANGKKIMTKKVEEKPK